MLVIIHLEPGMPSKRTSSTCADYVPVLCTHRPSLLPIEWSGENFGWRSLLQVAARWLGAMPEIAQTLPFRGRRSRNKVSVGEPADGSLTPLKTPNPKVVHCSLTRGKQWAALDTKTQHFKMLKFNNNTYPRFHYYLKI